MSWVSYHVHSVWALHRDGTTEKAERCVTVGGKRLCLLLCGRLPKDSANEVLGLYSSMVNVRTTYCDIPKPCIPLTLAIDLSSINWMLFSVERLCVFCDSESELCALLKGSSAWEDRALAEMVSRRTVTAKTRFWSQVNPYFLCAFSSVKANARV
jgi:hypothetical protein